MGVFLNMGFTTLIALLIHRYGHWVEIDGCCPDYFLICALFFLTRGPHPHLILVTAYAGWISDILSGHSWSLDACFVVLVHLMMDRLNLLSWLKSIWSFLLMLTLLGGAHLLWWKWLGAGSHLSHFGTQMGLNLASGFVMYFMFRGFRVGWGLRSSGDPYRILNA
jgi:hypothetical protein